MSCTYFLGFQKSMLWWMKLPSQERKKRMSMQIIKKWLQIRRADMKRIWKGSKSWWPEGKWEGQFIASLVWRGKVWAWNRGWYFYFWQRWNNKGMIYFWPETIIRNIVEINIFQDIGHHTTKPSGLSVGKQTRKFFLLA